MRGEEGELESWVLFVVTQYRCARARDPCVSVYIYVCVCDSGGAGEEGKDEQVGVGEGQGQKTWQATITRTLKIDRTTRERRGHIYTHTHRLGQLGHPFCCRLASPTLRFKLTCINSASQTHHILTHTHKHTKQQQLEDEATPYDAIIIGSGLAGISLLAEAVAQGYKRVIILEQKVRHTI
jgi:hypothetical protein